MPSPRGSLDLESPLILSRNNSLTDALRKLLTIQAFDEETPGNDAFRMGTWLGLLAASYGTQRLACRWHLPADCIVEMDALETFTNLTVLGLMGIVLAWLVGLVMTPRFDFLFSGARWYFSLLVLSVPLVYSILSDVPAFQHDFRDLPSWSWPFIALIAAVLLMVVGVLGFHLLWAYQSRHLTKYLLPRCTILGYCGMGLVTLSGKGHAIHFHHLYVGLALAMWADANHMLSAALLAIGAGIFCQGLGAYSFAPAILPLGCFDTPSAALLNCTFTGDTPFALRFCPLAGGVAMDHSCHAALE
ncbi:hypothetical protein ACKKBG_A08825 [Auxenochlorella protothecoides x Auxenochlorella symbiontica]